MADEATLSVSGIPTQQLPDDILIEIFLRLPVRSLLLFKLVSKHWLRLIKNPNFIHLHLNRPIDDDDSPSNNPIIILRRNLVLTLLSDDQTLPFKDDVALDFLTPYFDRGSSRLVGHCNGLFCITDRCISFGYDFVSYNYKLVEIKEQVVVRRGYPHHIDMRVGIYSLRTNCWKDINRVVIAERHEKLSTNRVFYSFFNGALHRLYNNKILVFDLHEDDFEWFDLPSTYEQNFGFEDHLSVLNESLVLIVHRKVRIEIWVMLEYGVPSSWTQLYNIMPPDVGVKKVLSFSNKGEFIIETRDAELASFDVKTMAIKLFNIKTRTFVPRLVDAFRYRESFVSLS